MDDDSVLCIHEETVIEGDVLEVKPIVAPLEEMEQVVCGCEECIWVELVVLQERYHQPLKEPLGETLTLVISRCASRRTIRPATCSLL